MMDIRAVMVGLAGAVLLTGCPGGQETEQVREQAQETLAAAEETAEEMVAEGMRLDEDVPRRAVAVLQPTEGNEASGTVTFEPGDKGLKVSTEARGLSPGEHGYHIHIYGDCTAPDGTSAGTHFNLRGSSLNPPEDIDRITGNLGNLSAAEDGSASHETVLEHAELTGPKSIIGRAVIVHAQPNDPQQPPIGAAGSRVACGVIGIGNPEG